MFMRVCFESLYFTQYSVKRFKYKKHKKQTTVTDTALKSVTSLKAHRRCVLYVTHLFYYKKKSC